MKGIGGDKCGEVLSDYDNSNEMHYWTRIQWLLGCITGRNYATDDLKGGDIEYLSIYYSVIKYCRNNPLNDLDDAMAHTYNYVLP